MISKLDQTRNALIESRDSLSKVLDHTNEKTNIIITLIVATLICIIDYLYLKEEN